MGSDDDLSLRLPKSPRRVGIEYAAVVAVIAIIVAVVAMPHGAGHRDDAFERGMYLGVGLTPALAVAYAIGYFRQRRRLRS
jgi:hypothetical protein